MSLLRSILRSSLPSLSALGLLAAARTASADLPVSPRERTLHRREAAAADRLRRYASPAATVPEGAFREARARWESLFQGPAGAASARPAPPPLPWRELGPAPLLTNVKPFVAGANWSPAAGRVTAIAIDPTDSKVIYAGAAIGGVWKSTDGGDGWAPLDDQMLSLAVGALAIDPTDPQTLWVGTGSGEPYSGPSGRGLLVTHDGGATWTRPGGEAFAGLSISRIVLDPEAGDMYVTALFGGAGFGEACVNTDIFAEGQGLFRSSDGGLTWSELLSGSFDDVEVDTSVTPRRILADEVFVGPRRSTDGGATWSAPGGLPEGTERVQFTPAPSDPNIVYAGVGYQGEGSLWFSTDAGATFTEVPGVPSYCEGQCYFDDVVAVKPDDPTTVFLGGALCSVWRITDAMGAAPAIKAVSSPDGDCGEDFANWYLSIVHPDAHAMLFDPNSADTLYVGSDGGLSRTKDLGESWEQLNTGVGTVQMYAVCADPSDPERVYAGAQDNGTMLRRSNGPSWVALSTGDGAGCAVSSNDSKRALVAANFGYAFASSDGFDKNAVIVFDTQKPYCQGLAGCGDRSGFLPPVAGHPTVPNSFFIGTYRLWRSLEGGKKGTWSAISDDLTAGPDSVQCVPPGTGSHADYLTAVGLSPSDPKTMYTGSAAGAISVTTDEGATWTRVASPVLPPRWLTGLAIDPVDPKIVAAAFSGFDKTTPETPGHVFVSKDGGATWSRSGPDIDLPLDAFVGHPSMSGMFYAGTDFGVIASNDGGDTWHRIGSGLPRSPVYSLSFRALTTSLVAGTHGRGAWEIAFVPSLGVSAPELTFEVVVGKDPDPQVLTISNEERFGSSLTASAQADADWITIAADGTFAGGSRAIEATVSVAAKGRAVGDYEGAITVTANAGMPTSITVPVHLRVVAEEPTGQTDADGDCSCSTPGSTSPRSALWALAVAGLSLGRGLRRRARRGGAPGSAAQ